ncbi:MULTISPECIES: DMT family transporter [Massilia]|jgi:multidrug transporter EmrE-like cation transporter|uniref:4-amino-4-deoxy-L-arabinose transferase n=2 Tax=Massilia TaxID=149698 RepID=A0A7X3G4H1_9BURK|nr:MULTISPECIES: 4-amino-4-deoxy-L-arabinose transferase [Telluria group]KQX96988.1 4-amino-4-deoxy-L-arabinose transferase [Massilia sp. Root133]KQZ52693.1 4-amino-4-deoxy-L-arabinose transferase [Massilia sp. Root1485]MDN4044651.1 4-amino-4-deoxy-L-arabinose transferase [Massilia sp. YIM B02787]MVW63358.1 4-amino-4-deoxy-L-arabinose transferase [Telluria cellulosilytica]
MNLTTFAFIISGVILNACAQLLLKAGTNAIGGAIHLTMSNWFETFVKVVTQLPILGGLACYAVSLVVWIIGLSRTDVTIAYPMLSLGYVVSAFGAWMFLGEAVSPQRLAAIGVIVVGVVLLART